MSIKSAIDAYRQSAYQYSEFSIEKSIGLASLPIFGGTSAYLKQIGNLVNRPFKMAGAFIFGGEHSINDVVQAEIPSDIAETEYGNALVKSRDFLRKSADRRTNAVAKLLGFDIVGYFRGMREANYTSHQQNHIVLPDEGTTILESVSIGSLVVALMAMKGMTRSYISSDLSGLISHPEDVSINENVVPNISNIAESTVEVASNL